MNGIPIRLTVRYIERITFTTSAARPKVTKNEHIEKIFSLLSKGREGPLSTDERKEIEDACYAYFKNESGLKKKRRARCLI